MENKDGTTMYTDIDDGLCKEEVNIYEYFHNLDIPIRDKKLLVGCITAITHHYAYAKVQIALAAATGLEPTDEKFAAMWNDIKDLILETPNDLYHNLMEGFEIGSDEEEEDCKQQN